MTISQNGYSVVDSVEDCKRYKVDDFYIPLRNDDCGFILANFVNRFDKEVEDLGRTETFGYNKRRISGSDDWSNHASATAVDCNSAQHPSGATGTFTPSEERKLEELLSDFDDVIKWGGTYRYAKDEMHFEIDKTYDEVHLLARVIRKKNTVILERLQPGKRNIDVYLVKRALDKRDLYDGTMTNYFGVALKNAYAEWQKTLGYVGVDADGIPGPSSLKALGFTVIE